MTSLESNPPEHSSLMGGSSCKQRIQCTGSAVLEAQMGDETSAYAQEGDALHELIYRFLDTGEEPSPEGQVVNVKGEDVFISKQVLQDKYEPMRDAVLKWMEDEDIEEYELELRVTLSKTCDERVFGRLDFVGRSRRGHVCFADFKFGTGVEVHARENYQLGFYAIGAYESGDPYTLNKEGGQVFDIHMTIFQCKFDGTVKVDTWETNVFWLEQLRLQISAAFARILSGDTALKAGDWCRFCRARPTCPAQNTSLNVFNNKAPTELANGMTVTELANLLDTAEEVEKQVAAVRKYARELGEAGTPIPGWKVVDKRGHRKFTNLTMAEQLAVARVGSEAYAPQTLKTPAQMEKAFRRAGASIAPLEDYIEAPITGTKLVRDTNPAPAIDAVVDLDVGMADIIPIKQK